MVVIYIDGDACPVKTEIERVATRHRIRAVLVSNGGLRPSANPLLEIVTVPATQDAADNWIVDHVVAGDLVITDDIYLAARCIAKQTLVLKTDGKKLTEANIGGILASRDLMADIRSANPFFSGKAKAFKKKDRYRFIDSLETLLRE